MRPHDGEPRPRLCELSLMPTTIRPAHHDSSSHQSSSSSSFIPHRYPFVHPTHNHSCWTAHPTSRRGPHSLFSNHLQRRQLAMKKSSRFASALSAVLASVPLAAAGTPAARWGHQAVYVPSQQAMYVVGGQVQSTDTQVTNEVLVLPVSGPYSLPSATSQAVPRCPSVNGSRCTDGYSSTRPRRASQRAATTRSLLTPSPLSG